MIVLDLGYNLIVCGIVGINKIIYIHKFPPALNTTIKPQIVESKTGYEHKFNTNLRKETVTNVYVLYIKTDTENEPEEIDYEDKIEVGKKY